LGADNSKEHKNMANLGNAWHIPDNPEPPGRAGMRDPIGAIVPGTAVTIITGNQFQGAGNPGNQLQTGSALFFKRAADANWTELPLIFLRTLNNNKYYAATIPAGTFQTGDGVQYYLRIPYDDHDTTFLRAQGDASATTADEAAARATPFTFPVENSAVKGQWGPVFTLPNVAIHAHVLPNGRVLMWGRRDNLNDSLDVHECTPFVWNPEDGKTTNTPQPTLADGTKVNLFCSGHAFLPDGRLLVVGGHLEDSDGLNQATLYDPANNRWTPTALMNKGRWYPTATTLPDGSVLVLAGSYKDKGKIVHNMVPQVWKNGAWTPIAAFPDHSGELELYPRMHVAADGQVFMSGPLEQTYSLKTSNRGQWTVVAPRELRQRDYCPAVMYDENKVIYIGGGGGNGKQPTAEAEIIDLSQNPRQWRKTNPMRFPRRQHNATLLPDGTVVVTGGTRGGGGRDNGFNDLRGGQPIHIAELWDPKGETGKGVWTQLAAEAVDRCYHATAVLLPDARVLSAGGGEYRPGGQENPPEDSHRDAQIFSPPYLFKGVRPEIIAAPASVSYGESFEVGTPQPNDIGTVSWVRLPSVTHAFDQSQRINFLQFQVDAGTLTVTAPHSPNICPPGHYMLFILNQVGVPSVAKIIQIQAPVAPAAVAARAPEPELLALSPVVSEPGAYMDAFARQAAVAAAAKGTAVVVGITGTCPYGIAACWGGAHEALYSLEGVDLVNPIPNADDSTAEVFLEGDRVPALDRWDEQFHSIVNGRYELRGVEVTLQGGIEEREGQLFLAGSGQRPPVQLAPLAAADKIQWDHAAQTPKPLDAGEALAYERLTTAFRDLADGQQVTVTGPLKQTEEGYQLQVRRFRHTEIVQPRTGRGQRGRGQSGRSRP
jgi:galactose oxidase